MRELLLHTPRDKTPCIQSVTCQIPPPLLHITKQGTIRLSEGDAETLIKPRLHAAVGWEGGKVGNVSGALSGFGGVHLFSFPRLDNNTYHAYLDESCWWHPIMTRIEGTTKGLPDLTHVTLEAVQRVSILGALYSCIPYLPIGIYI